MATESYEIRSGTGRPIFSYDNLTRATEELVAYRAQRRGNLRLFKITRVEEEIHDLTR